MHVAFTTPVQGSNVMISSDENQNPNEENSKVTARFAVMGEYGNNVNIYDSHSFIVKNQI